MHTNRHVAVIGAGLSGLVAVKELVDEGHRVTCFEMRGREGGVFASATGVAYARMRLTVSQHFMAFSSMTPGADEPRVFWTRERYLQYLHEFGERFDLMRHIRFDTQVDRIRRLSDGRLRLVWTKNVDGARSHGEGTFDAVAVCQGAFRANAPRWPAIPGRETFTGRMVHSADYSGPEAFAGRRVLVVGIGETSADVTRHLADVADRCWLTFHSYPELLARYPYGLPHTSDAWSARLNHWIPRSRLTAFRAQLDLHNFFGPLAPRHRLVAEWSARSGHGKSLQKNDDFVPSVLSGDIEVVPGGVAQIAGNEVYLASGQTLQPDDIIFCTGYEENSIPAAWLDGVEIDDVRELFKHAFHPVFGDRVAFIGWARPRHGGFPACSEMVARYFALLCSGHRQLPGDQALHEAIARDRERNQAEFHNAPGIRTLVHFTRFMDELAELIGCRPRIEDYLDDPGFLYSLICGGNLPASYRLRGPHADPERAQALIRALPVAYPRAVVEQRLAAALEGRVSPTIAKQVEQSILAHLDQL